VLLLLVVVLGPRRDGLPEPGGEGDGAHDDDERVRVQAAAPTARLGQRRRVALRVSSDELLLVGLRAGVVRLLRVVRAALDQPDSRQDEERELKVFRLPVPRARPSRSATRRHSGRRDRLAAVLSLLGVEASLAGKRLPGQGDEEERQEEDGEAVAAEPGANALEMSEADGDVQGQAAGDHQDVDGEHRAHREPASSLLEKGPPPTWRAGPSTVTLVRRWRPPWRSRC
jgi:hypothetical protein